MVSCHLFTILNFQCYYCLEFFIVNVVIIKNSVAAVTAKRLVTLNEHNCFITLTCLKHFSKPRKDRYIFLLKGYFVKIKHEHGNVHFNYFSFQIFHADNVMRTFYKLAVTMQYNVIMLQLTSLT